MPDLNLPQPPPNPSPSDYWDGEGKRDGIHDGGVTAATAAPEDGSGGGVSGPFINRGLSGDVVGVLGKEVRLNCHVTNLGNKTVRKQFNAHHFAPEFHKKTSRIFRYRYPGCACATSAS